MVTPEEKKAEVLERLEILKNKGIKYGAAIRCIKEGNDIAIFENQGFCKSVFYKLYLNAGDEFYDTLIAVKEDLEKDGKLVYLILVSHTAYGTLCDFFFVDDYKTDWKREKKDLKDGYAYVYSYNLECDYNSDFGSIFYGADPLGGGIYRAH